MNEEDKYSSVQRNTPSDRKKQQGKSNFQQNNISQFKSNVHDNESNYSWLKYAIFVIIIALILFQINSLYNNDESSNSNYNNDDEVDVDDY